jgi:ribosomal protein S18 acetylase RimI-like enzyme
MLPKIITRSTQPRDFAGITEMCLAVYPETRPWREEQLASHLRVFPEGQFVAVEEDTQRVVGMAASLVLRWDDYYPQGTWKDFTDHGMFTNHDLAEGKTLYGAEIMVRPRVQRRGVGSKLYKARRELAERLQLRRIRAAARLRGYHRYASQMSAEEYAIKVVRGEIKGPTLSFQLKHGFEVIAVVSGYLKNDPESMGYAAIIEWLNSKVAQPADYAERDPRFLQTLRRRS